MKSRRERSNRMRVLRLWTLPEVQKAVPYLRSVTSSLREHWMEVLHTMRRKEIAAKEPKASGRAGLLANEKLQDERERAQQRFDDALAELNKIDIFLLDAVQGLAMIPFRNGEDLAWYVFDLFNEEGLIGWRNHSDPIEECKPLSEAPQPIANDSVSS